MSNGSPALPSTAATAWPLYSTFFDARSKAARDQLEQTQNRLSAFQKERGIIANDERFDVENARLNELSQQIVALQGHQAQV